MKRAAVLLALVLAGCAGPGAPPPGPVSVHIVHRYQEAPTPAQFDVPAGAGVLRFSAKLENFYKGRCPAPTGELTIREPGGAVYARLQSEDLPLADCVYETERNETLAAGTWTVEYAGGSASLGSIVDVGPVTAS